jgi:hypothetical protein
MTVAMADIVDVESLLDQKDLEHAFRRLSLWPMSLNQKDLENARRRQRSLLPISLNQSRDL